MQAAVRHGVDSRSWRREACEGGIERGKEASGPVDVTEVVWGGLGGHCARTPAGEKAGTLIDLRPGAIMRGLPDDYREGADRSLQGGLGGFFRRRQEMRKKEEEKLVDFRAWG